jgi:hypothetical protein
MVDAESKLVEEVSSKGNHISHVIELTKGQLKLPVRAFPFGHNDSIVG